jgi:hypothetical protein
VVGGLLLCVLAALGYGLFRPRPSADELFAAAQPLLASDDPADWDRAVDDYLDPLARRYPDYHPDEVKRETDRVTARKEQRRLIGQGARARYGSEAERWYQVGLRQAQAGDLAGARRTWEHLTRAFAGDPDRLWAELAAAGLAELGRASQPSQQAERAGLTAAVERAKATHDPATRSAALAALVELYRDDPVALDLIRRAGPP